MSPKQFHEKDVTGRQVVDFEERIDVKRMRRDRIARLQAEIAKADLGAILLWDPVNMRYATGTRLMESFMLRHKNKSVLVPREGRAHHLTARTAGFGRRLMRRSTPTPAGSTPSSSGSWAPIHAGSNQEMGRGIQDRA